jgi:hypothetical protein
MRTPIKGRRKSYRKKCFRLMPGLLGKKAKGAIYLGVGKTG